jgi:hypothetical protein
MRLACGENAWSWCKSRTATGIGFEMESDSRLGYILGMTVGDGGSHG